MPEIGEPSALFPDGFHGWIAINNFSNKCAKLSVCKSANYYNVIFITLVYFGEDSESILNSFGAEK